MKEKHVRQKLFKVARKMGYVPITQTDTQQCPKCHTLVKPPIGRPDMLWLHPNQASRVCEVKVLRAGDTSFRFEEIDERQRKWLDWWTQEQRGLGYIGFGVIRQHGQRQHLDHLYLVDWPAWKEMENQVSPIQESVPLEAGKGYRKELQEGQLDIKHLLAAYELTRENGHWKPPKGSTIYGI